MNADDQWCYYSGVRDANCVNTENQWCYYNGVKDANYVNTDDQWCYYRGVKDANIWEDTILNTNLSKNDFLTIFFRGNGKTKSYESLAIMQNFPVRITKLNLPTQTFMKWQVHTPLSF